MLFNITELCYVMARAQNSAHAHFSIIPKISSQFCTNISGQVFLIGSEMKRVLKVEKIKETNYGASRDEMMTELTLYRTV